MKNMVVLVAGCNPKFEQILISSSKLANLPEVSGWKYLNMLDLSLYFFGETNFKSNYFTSSDPHHDMLGGGCH